MTHWIEARAVERKMAPHKEGLDAYLGNLTRWMGMKESPFDPLLPKNAIDILSNHTQSVIHLKTDRIQAILDKERQLKGDAKEGFIICVDGRLINLLFAGKHTNMWEEPASLFKTKTNSKGQLVVESKALSTAIEKTAKEDNRDLFEMVLAHTSLTTDHICGKASALSKQAGHPMFGLSGRALAIKNLEMLEAEQIPAITNTYNNAREQSGNPKLNQVAVSALFDTDTYGIVLNYGKEGKNELSTTTLLESGLKAQMEAKFGEIAQFGKYNKTLDNTDHFIRLYSDLINITEKLINGEVDGFSQVSAYIATEYPDLSPIQKKAFIFTMARTISLQYITGLSHLPVGEHPKHPFAEHAEGYATITTEGSQAIIGKNDTVNQSFGVTASTKAEAQGQIKDVVLPLLDKNHEKIGGVHRHSIFITAPCDTYGREKDVAIQQVEELMKNLLEVPMVLERVREGNLLLIPVLVDKDTSDILEIPKLPMFQ